MDMSKAFDNVKRKELIEDLRNLVNPDELHLINILLQAKFQVKCGNEVGEVFDTDTGVPQGDCLSANEFTLYLAKTLEPHMNRLNQIQKIQIQNEDEMCSKHKSISLPEIVA